MIWILKKTNDKTFKIVSLEPIDISKIYYISSKKSGLYFLYRKKAASQ